VSALRAEADSALSEAVEHAASSEFNAAKELMQNPLHPALAKQRTWTWRHPST